MDYNYVLQGAGGTVGDNGFGYRRLYFTTTYRISEKMRFQARLETNDDTTNDSGLPTPFEKDLFLRWDDALGKGHRITIGIAPPPSFNVSERFFGFRSLEKTIMDKNKIVSSRDMGVMLSGNVVSDGSLRYAFMIANNNSVKADNDRHKRVYGQLEWYPADNITVTAGTDYASIRGGSSITANGFVGYEFSKGRVGVEGYVNPVRVEDSLLDTDRRGVTFFGIVSLSEQLELIGRYDAYGTEANGNTLAGDFGLLGVSWAVEDQVRIIPNLELENRPGADEAELLGRITLHVDF